MKRRGFFQKAAEFAAALAGAALVPAVLRERAPEVAPEVAPDNPPAFDPGSIAWQKTHGPSICFAVHPELLTDDVYAAYSREMSKAANRIHETEMLSLFNV